MKICILTASLNHGGVSIVALDVAKGMAIRGHEVFVVCSGKHYETIIQDGYIIYVLPNKFKNPIYHYFNFFLLIKLIKFLRKKQPDIIHVHNINLQTFSLGALILSHFYPMVWTLHDIWPLCLTGWPPVPDCNGMLHRCEPCPTWSRWMVWINRQLKEVTYRFAPLHLISPSQWLASKTSSSKLSYHPLYLIYNGIDPNNYSFEQRNSVRSRLGISETKKVILFCGGKKLADQLPAWRKGWKYLCKALEVLSLKYDNLHLLYIGDRLELSPALSKTKVSFVEGVNREEMRGFYNASDIFVLPTIADHPALTILEAMAFKVPVISTWAGGIPEAVIDNETGLLCSSRNAACLAEKIDYLISNHAHAEQMTEKAYQRFSEMFTFGRMIDQHKVVYQKTISDFKHRQ